MYQCSYELFFHLNKSEAMSLHKTNQVTNEGNDSFSQGRWYINAIYTKYNIDASNNIFQRLSGNKVISSRFTFHFYINYFGELLKYLKKIINEREVGLI